MADTASIPQKVVISCNCGAVTLFENEQPLVATWSGKPEVVPRCFTCGAELVPGETRPWPRAGADDALLAEEFGRSEQGTEPASTDRDVEGTGAGA